MGKHIFVITLSLIIVASAWADNLRVEVKVEGVSGEILDNVLSSLRLYRERDNPLLTEELVQRYHRSAPEEIKLALEPFGYYRPHIQSQLSHEQDAWKADYRIETGAPMRLGQVEVKITGTGRDDPVFKAWRKSYPLHEGDILQHQKYEEAKKTLLRLASEKGYLNGKLTRHEIRVDLEKYVAGIFLSFETGERYRFGTVSFYQDYFNPAFLSGFVPFKKGDPYDASKLLDLQRNLTSTDYFERIDVRPLPEAVKDLEVPIEVHLALQKPTHYKAGLGFGTDTGPRVSLGVERRRINRKGHRAGADLTVSGIGANFAGHYTIPLSKPSTDSLSFLAGFEKIKTDTSTQDTRSVTVSLVNQLESWLRTLALGYQQENFEVGEEKGRSRLLIPRAAWQRVKADNRLNPNRGWRLDLELKGAAQALVSDTSFVQGRIFGKDIRSPWKRGRLITRANLGATWVSEFDKLPPSLRFFAGGDVSVRGYKFESLGPTDSANNVIGGHYLLVGSLEYEHSITQRIALAAFYDVGNAFDLEDITIKSGAGLGVRYKLPFGTVRLDLASALSEPGSPLRIHLSIGPDL